VIVEDLNKVPLFTPRWGLAPVVLLVHHLFGATAFSEANPLLAAATWLLERPVPRSFRNCPTIAVSESTREDLGRRGMDASRIRVIPNGIEVDAFRPVEGEPRFDEPTFVFLGRIKRYKRIDLVVEAIAALRQRGLQARFLVAGRGDQVNSLKALASRLGVEDDVEFLGFISEERKRELLRRSWAHVLTSAKEGWGISNIEAAAAGTPTVASDSPGLRESVIDGETGYLVPHGDVDSLTERLASLIEDPRSVERLGAGARRFAERFSWDASAGQVLAVLRDAVAPPPGDP
jgi:glycosyltransferase involved in cell wall biosynthesis